MLSVAVVAEA